MTYKSASNAVVESAPNQLRANSPAITGFTGLQASRRPWQPPGEERSLELGALHRGVQNHLAVPREYFAQSTSPVPQGEERAPYASGLASTVVELSIDFGTAFSFTGSGLASGSSPEDIRLPSLKEFREDLRAALRSCGHEELADRVVELSRLHKTDDDEPELSVASLRELIRAMAFNPKLKAPELTLSDDGFIHAEWRTSDGGTVAATFHPESRVEFGAISAPFSGAARGTEILRVGGFHHTKEAMSALRWHIDRIVSRDDRNP